jgi:hypothetical protein
LNRQFSGVQEVELPNPLHLFQSQPVDPINDRAGYWLAGQNLAIKAEVAWLAINFY